MIDLDQLEALCAAAHDCDPSGRRPVGLPAPVLRELATRLAAAERELAHQHAESRALGEAATRTVLEAHATGRAAGLREAAKQCDGFVTERLSIAGQQEAAVAARQCYRRILALVEVANGSDP